MTPTTTTPPVTPPCHFCSVYSLRLEGLPPYAARWAFSLHFSLDTDPRALSLDLSHRRKNRKETLRTPRGSLGVNSVRVNCETKTSLFSQNLHLRSLCEEKDRSGIASQIISPAEQGKRGTKEEEGGKESKQGRGMRKGVRHSVKILCTSSNLSGLHLCPVKFEG